MTSRELVKAAIGHQCAPRVPYFLNVCPDAWEAMKKIAGKKTLEEFLDNDVKDIPVPWWGWHELSAEWGLPDPPVVPPTVFGTGSYAALTDAIKAAKDSCDKDKYFLVQIYGSHFEKAYFSRGIENFLADMAGEPEFARKLLIRIIDKNMVMLENFLALPEIDGVLLGSDWGSQRDLLMSFDTWQEMIRPGEQKEYDLIHSYGKDVWVHSCGNIEKIIPSLVEMGVDVLNPIQPEAMDIFELKQKHGRKLTFWGGISTQKTLPFGTPEEVKAEARQVRATMSRNGGYIFSAAQAIQNDVPAENFLALLDVARERSSQD